MSVSAGRAQLEEARKDLRRNWDRVRHSWRDPVSERYEQEVIVTFERKIKSVIPALDQITDLLNRVRRDCK